MNVSPAKVTPVVVEVPKVASSPKTTKLISIIPESIAMEKIAIPEVSALSVPTVALSPKPIDVPKIRKKYVLNLRQAPEENSAKNIIATMVADAEKLCANLSNVNFSGITKTKIKTVVHSFEPVKQVAVRPACAVIDASTHSFVVPDIPRLGAMRFITVDEMKGHSNAIIRAMHDLKKELNDM